MSLKVAIGMLSERAAKKILRHQFLLMASDPVSNCRFADLRIAYSFCGWKATRPACGNMIQFSKSVGLSCLAIFFALSAGCDPLSAQEVENGTPNIFVDFERHLEMSQPSLELDYMLNRINNPEAPVFLSAVPPHISGSPVDRIAESEYYDRLLALIGTDFPRYVSKLRTVIPGFLDDRPVIVFGYNIVGEAGPSLNVPVSTDRAFRLACWRPREPMPWPESRVLEESYQRFAVARVVPFDEIPILPKLIVAQGNPSSDVIAYCHKAKITFLRVHVGRRGFVTSLVWPGGIPQDLRTMHLGMAVSKMFQDDAEFLQPFDEYDGRSRDCVPYNEDRNALAQRLIDGNYDDKKLVKLNESDAEEWQPCGFTYSDRIVFVDDPILRAAEFAAANNSAPPLVYDHNTIALDFGSHLDRDDVVAGAKSLDALRQVDWKSLHFWKALRSRLYFSVRLVGVGSTSLSVAEDLCWSDPAFKAAVKLENTLPAESYNFESEDQALRMRVHAFLRVMGKVRSKCEAYPSHFGDEAEFMAVEPYIMERPDVFGDLLKEASQKIYEEARTAQNRTDEVIRLFAVPLGLWHRLCEASLQRFGGVNGCEQVGDLNDSGIGVPVGKLLNSAETTTFQDIYLYIPVRDLSNTYISGVLKKLFASGTGNEDALQVGQRHFIPDEAVEWMILTDPAKL